MASAVRFAEFDQRRSTLIMQMLVRKTDWSANFCAPVGLNTGETLAFMRSSTLFADLDQEQCVKIASAALARQLCRDDFLFLQGHPVRNVTVLRSGCVKLIRVSPNGHEALVRVSGVGGVVNFGGSSSLCHACSARVTETGEALVWDYSRLQILFASYPKLQDNFNRELVSQLADLEQRYREIATEKVEARLALLLLRLRKQIGKRTDRGVQVSLRREELAQMTGATLFTISRFLSRWAQEGLILSRREAVIIVDPYRLNSVHCRRAKPPC